MLNGGGCKRDINSSPIRYQNSAVLVRGVEVLRETGKAKELKSFMLDTSKLIR
jgi:hypothetical protein